MWVESFVEVGDQRVGLSVRRLDDEERERTATVFAWLTLDAIRSGTETDSAVGHVQAVDAEPVPPFPPQH